MEKIYRYLLYCAAVVVCTGMPSCDDDDWDEQMEETILISSITLGETIYNTDASTLYMLPNQEVQLTYTIYPDSADDKAVAWTSSNEETAVVSGDGLLVTKAVGTSVITVTPEIGFGPSAAMPSYTLNVVDHFTYIEEITVADAESLATEGIAETATYQLEVSASPSSATFKRYTYESADTTIATVDEDGVVTGVSEGTTTITITADDFNPNPVSTTVEVTVTPVVVPESIEFTDDAVQYLSALGYGEEYDLKEAVTLTPENATVEVFSWSSSNESVVTVDDNGILTVAESVMSGSAVITASYGSISATVTVTVAEGRLWYSFENSISPWYMGDSGSSYTSDGTKTRVTLNSSYQGSFSFTSSGSNPLTVSPGYPILALKIMLPTKVNARNNNSGTIFIDTDQGRYYQTSGNGNNVHTVLVESEYDDSGILPTTPMICYYNLYDSDAGFGPSSSDGTTYFLSETDAESFDTFKFGIYDFGNATDNLGYYDIYWVRSFASVDDLVEYVESVEGITID